MDSFEKKANRRKNIRVSNDEEITVDEGVTNTSSAVEESEIVKKVLESRKSKTSQKSHSTSSTGSIRSKLSFDDDENKGDVESITKKPTKKKAVVSLDEVLVSEKNDSRSYSKRDLDELKTNSLKPQIYHSKQEEGQSDGESEKNRFIPDDKTIEEIKRKKETMRRRNISNHDQSESKDYIPLTSDNKDDPEALYNGRLVREEDEMGDGEEAFEDYEESRIGFGNQSLKKFMNDRISDMNNLIQEAEEDQDETSAEWEKKLIHRGLSKKESILEEEEDNFRPYPKGLNPSPIPKPTPIMQIEEIERALVSSFNNLMESHSQKKRRTAQIEKEIEELQTSVKSFHERLGSLSSSYKYFQEIRVFFETLGECFDEKIPRVEELEEDYYEFLKLKKEGKETSEEEESEFEKKIIEKVKYLFHDVEEEYKNIVIAKEKLESFKFQQNQAYKDTYITLSLRHVFEPFVRLEIILWNPFESKITISEMKWFKELKNFGVNQQEPDFDDPDLDLITKIVEKVIGPKVAYMIPKLFNPFLKEHNFNLLNLVEQLIDLDIKSSPPFKSIINSIVESFEKELDLVHQPLSLENIQLSQNLVI